MLSRASRGGVPVLSRPMAKPARRNVRAKPIENVPETQNEARFILKLGDWVTGIVLGPDGKPLANASIEVRSKGHPTRTIGVGDDARFSLAVAPGETIDIVLRSARDGTGRPTAESSMYEGELLGVRGGDTDLELKVTKPAMGRTLLVRVEGPDGDPLEGVSVFASPAPRTTKSRGRTDAAGRVELGDLPAREIKVSAGESAAPAR